VESTHLSQPLRRWTSSVVSAWRACPPIKVEHESELWRKAFLLQSGDALVLNITEFPNQSILGLTMHYESDFGIRWSRWSCKPVTRASAKANFLIIEVLNALVYKLAIQPC
jgi:hypothetical protein